MAKNTPKKRTTTTTKTTKKTAAKAQTSSSKTTRTKAVVAVSPKKVSDSAFSGLNRWHKIVAALLAAQAVAVVVLSKSFSVPLTTSYLTTDSLAKGTGYRALLPGVHNVWSANLVYLVGGFLLAAAAAHVLIASVYRGRYEANLAQGINKARWVEGAVSGSLIMVTIGVIVGVRDLSSLLMILVLVTVMHLIGLSMEVYRQNDTTVSWLSYSAACKAGAVGWLVFLIYIAGAGLYGAASLPGFVYILLASSFVLFGCLGVIIYWQYRRKGRWADSLYSERAYMVLSLALKTLVAWQIFFGVLHS